MLNKITYVLSIMLILLVVLAVPVSANELKISPVLFDGHNTYIIQESGSDGFKSELVFPLEVKALEMEYSIKTDYPQVSSYNFYISHNLTESAGKFVDSDWLYSYQEDKAIYSESDADLDFYLMGLELESTPLQFFNWGGVQFNSILGYRHQYFDYDVSNLMQENYLDNKQTKVNGKVLTYETTYQFPYAGFKLSSTEEENLSWEFVLNYSPLVRADDKDIHLLRDKVSNISAEGDGVELDLGVKYKLRPSLSINLGLNYISIDTDGEQVQKNYEGEVLFDNIDAKLKSEQKSISVGVDYNF